MLGSEEFTVVLLDQFGEPMPGVEITERIVFDKENSIPQNFNDTPSGKTITTGGRGQFKDIFDLPIVGALPRNTFIPVSQIFDAEGREVINHIIITRSDISDSYPLTLR